MLSVIKHAINYYEKKRFFFRLYSVVTTHFSYQKIFSYKKAIHKISKNKSINGLVSIEKAKPLQWMGRIDLNGRFFKHTKAQKRSELRFKWGDLYF